MKLIFRSKIWVMVICMLLVFSSVAWAIKCPVCKATNKESNIYCKKCGAELRPMPEEVRFKGPKKTIGVLSFENKTALGGALGSDFSDQLTDALMKSGQFIVVARQDLESVITEQDMAATDRFAASKVAEKGKLVPAQLIIKGAITEFESQAKGGGTDVRFGNFGAGDFGISGETVTAHVACIVYIIDSTTGQVLDSERVEGKAQAGGMGFDWGYRDHVALGTSGFAKTPLGKATQLTIDKAVKYIADKIAAVPWEGRVVKVEGSIVFVNAGKEGNMQVGDTFNVYGEGEVLTDPVTGLPLGAEKSKIGKVIVNEVQDKFSKASIVDSPGEIKRGDLLMVE